MEHTSPSSWRRFEFASCLRVVALIDAGQIQEKIQVPLAPTLPPRRWILSQARLLFVLGNASKGLMIREDPLLQTHTQTNKQTNKQTHTHNPALCENQKEQSLFAPHWFVVLCHVLFVFVFSFFLSHLSRGHLPFPRNINAMRPRGLSGMPEHVVSTRRTNGASLANLCRGNVSPNSIPAPSASRHGTAFCTGGY